MAQLILSRVAAAAARAVAPQTFKAIAARLAARAGAALGRRIDAALFPERRSVGPRLTDLHVQGSQEGESLPMLFGRMRIAGQVIWAARFKAHATTKRSGGKTGAKVTTTRYTISFAVALCEGVAHGIGRVWANGAPLDLSGVAWRFHPGTEDQAPDPVIEAVEGVDAAPAYRGVAYVVFEDLPLDAFGDTLPQLSFEVLRTPPAAPGPARLEDLTRGVCLIPGAGEFAYATQIVRRVDDGRLAAAENCHVDARRADLVVALDDLARAAPGCRTVTLVIGWFGDDLRAGLCKVRPGVDRRDKTTAPLAWRVSGVDRASAYLVSTHDGAPAYGGSPSDDSVLQAIAALKARGYAVTLAPFLFMDVPAGATKPDPNGTGAQPAYPWRGRLRPAAADRTAGVASDVAAFFGTCGPQHVLPGPHGPLYAGPDEWSWRRFVLHVAGLARAAGGVDAILIGSELRGLTTARDAAGAFPAVAQLRALARDVRTMLGPGVKITYAADWTEYAGVSGPNGEKIFHLDPLWADPVIDAVAIDWYPPLTDWRDGEAHLDTAIAESPDDPAYLDARVEGGEAYAWFYANAADRSAQKRTPIADGVAGEAWIWRAKDLRAFWSNRHFDRPGGMRATTPTAWVPGSKPIWLAELGAPAVDKAGNAPNVFPDAKSSESAAPPFSSGARDDIAQRRVLEAILRHYAEGGPNNPSATLYAGAMIDMSRTCLWAWDARPFPAFPARADVWADADAWRTGHWLNGRLGAGDLAAVVADVCARAGCAEIDVTRLTGVVAGYVVDAPTTAADALAPLMSAHAFGVTAQAGRLVFLPENGRAPRALAAEDLCVAPAVRVERPARGALAADAAVRFVDPENAYRIGAVVTRGADAGDAAGLISIDAPFALGAAQAAALGAAALARQARASVRFAVPETRTDLAPGDAVRLDGLGAATFRIERIETHAATLQIEAVERGDDVALRAGATPAPPSPDLAPDPRLIPLDLPPLPGAEEDARPLVAVVARPMRALDLYANGALAARAERAATVGALEWALWPGPVGVWDRGNVVRLRMPGAPLASVDDDAARAVANLFAIGQADGGWELVGIRQLTLVGPDLYEAAWLLRGLAGSEGAMGRPAPVGAPVVRLDDALVRLDLDPALADGARLAAVAAGMASETALREWPIAWRRVWARPFAPCHLRARRRADGDVVLSWIRRARRGGDDWTVSDPPLGEERERYRLEILNAGAPVRIVETEAPGWTYAAADQIADFGYRPGWLAWRVAQISSAYGPGGRSESSGAL
ncbi:MAG: glycoside hydrolase TIM-barrel-like domain-containing protein [Alphaproteobacteria bacterium]|nr:glycoside hydrolase TIM-barrel-like domain-containing protein [Alphaproteobacteria bacterium]